ncbi:hypothetical protein LJ737_15260 [Hymenobacter sp. 15J16-1T3B]|uniref:hypothetical protein n=1 Tax=Hymenobacter sp. 15J16-1T3B TaxID=2886941 RepID=UPI001D11AA7E|nr:hypothetical protein [Hymenobacter sp. 15J16-1T3B]MCC3158607.1 hypothetical protein [Hymenobacter sp. 15J16-1T3B]
MLALNQTERRSHIWQFALLYLLALALPLGASYFLFSNSGLVDENARLRAQLSQAQQEQGQLAVVFDTLSHRLQRVDALDQRLRVESNDMVQGQLVTANQDNLNAIVTGLNELRRDSAGMQVAAHRQIARNILRDFDLFRANRGTIDLLRQELGKTGDAAKGSEKLAMELSQAKQQIILLQTALQAASQSHAAAPAPVVAAAPAPKPKAGGGAAPMPSVSALMENAMLRDQLAFAEADCLRQRGLDYKPSSRERKQLLEQSRTAFVKLLENPATADMKQDVEKTLESINTELGRPARFFGLL